MPSGVPRGQVRITGPGTVCKVEQCGREVKTKGLCLAHYSRSLTGKPLSDPMGVPRGDTLKRDELGRKQCRRCQKWQDEHLFGANKNALDGINPICKLCRNEIGFQKRYKLSLHDFAYMLTKQQGCAICHTWEPGKGNWQVDHDHACCPVGRSGGETCGKCVRGILCPPCNRLLGAARDNTNTLRSAAGYLERGRIEI